MIEFISQHIPLSVTLGLLITYINICLGYYIFHRFFIFFPSRVIDRIPSDIGMLFEEVFIPSLDKTMLQLWLIPGSPIKSREKTANFTILFFPGNEGTLSKFVLGMKTLQEAGFNICMFSYRGFGKSDRKRPFESGLRQDAQAVWLYLNEQQNSLPKNVLFYGQSIGCGLASWACVQFKPNGLILEGAFPSVADVAKKAVPWLPVNILTTERFSTKDHIQHVSCPTLIAHSIDDKAIPYSVGEILYSTAHDPKFFVKLSGTHAKGLEESKPVFTQALIHFVNIHL